MQQEGNGWWTAKIDLAPGDYEFSYLVNQSAWLPDYAASGVKRNGFGGWVSQLHVGEVHKPAISITTATKHRQAA